MLKKINVIIVLTALLLNSCNNKMKSYYYDDDCDYYNCNSVEPFYTYLEIDFSRTLENPNPNIYIMLGDFEDNNIIDTIKTDTIEDYLFSTETSVLLNYNYTVYAEYYVGNDTILAIDGAFVHKESYTECDSTCWKVKNNYFNVKLKVNN